jgi:hypothetical protein
MKQVEEVTVYRAPYLGALLAGLATFALYAITLAPTTAFWDTSEYIATAHILGIPHPPGNPLFVVLARAWELLLAPTGLSVPVRVNLFSAFMGALAHGCWFLLAHRVLATFSDSRLFRMVGAAVAVAVSATAFTVWNQSNVNEKVYTVSLFTIALLSWLAFRWRDHLGEGKDDNLLLLGIYVLALSVGNHLMAFLAAPALFVFILLVHPRSFANWKLYPAALIAVVLGLSIHLFLPIRAGLDPVINEADPTCESLGGGLTSVLTMGGAGCTELSASLKRQQYDKPSMFADPVVAGQTGEERPRSARLVMAQLGNYFQYFDWQWARSVAGNRSWFGGLRPLITLLFIGLGVLGAATHYRRDRVSWAYVLTLFLTLSFGLTFYLNFRYGFTYPLGGSYSDMREVRERDYFFIASFSIWGIWAGIGIAALWQMATERLAAARGGLRRAELMAAPVLLLAAIPLFANWTWASRSHDYSARDWAYNLLMSLEPYAVLFTNGDNDTFPLWYLQEVEGIRRDVTVMVLSYLNTPWYVKQIRQLTAPCAAGTEPLDDPTRIICQRPYEPEHGPEIYAQSMVPTDQPGVSIEDIPPGRRPPTRSIIQFSDEQIDQVANTPPFLLQENRVFQAGEITTTLPQNTVTIPADVFMAHIVSEAIADRPIYYAMTTQGFEELNLGGYLIRQGVAFKLNNGPVQADSARGIYQIENPQLSAFTGPYIDLARTEMLVSDVFVHRGGFPEWGHWVDSATEGIPYYYAYTHYGLALVYQQLGRAEDAQRHMAEANRFYQLAEKRRSE